MVYCEDTIGNNSSFYCGEESKSIPFELAKYNGDYHVLHKSIERYRRIYRHAQLDLGSSLHQLGEHHVRNKEYAEAITSFSEALHLKSEALGYNTEEKEFNLHSHSIDPETEEGRSELETVVSTISNIGNIHSQLGDHAEAMKCYTEIMTIRASFSTLSRDTQQNSGCSGLQYDEDDSAELNEDIQALDDLFQDISFRDTGIIKCQHTASMNRKSTATEFNTATTAKKTNKAISSDTSSRDSEIKYALKAYRDLLDNYSGKDLRVHEGDYKLLFEQVNDLSKGFHQHEKFKEKSQSLREKSLYMAIIVYDRIRTAQQAIADAFYGKVDEGNDSNVKQHQQASINIASTMIRIGSLHYKLSNVDEELHMYNQALITYTKVLGEIHPYVAGTRKNIGMVLAERSEFNAAMEQFSKARSIYSHINKDSDMSSDVASALSCMGNVQNRRGEFDSALSLHSKALYIFRTLAEESGWSSTSMEKVISTLKIIGMVYVKRDDLHSAMNCFKEALDLLRQEGSSEVSNGVAVASIQTRMGGIYCKKGLYDDAMAQFREAYKVASIALGTETHPEIAGIMHYMGVVYQKRSNYEKAMTCYKESVSMSRATLGPNNPSVATTLVCIGSMHFIQNNLNEAMEFYKEAYCLYENAYGPRHPQVAPTLKSVAMIHTKKKEYGEAMDIFQEVLRMKCVALGSCHPEIANAYKSIANIHTKRGEFEEALRQYKHAFDIYQRTLGEHHRHTKSIRSNMNLVHEYIRKTRTLNRDKERKDLRPYKRRVISSSRFGY